MQEVHGSSRSRLEEADVFIEHAAWRKDSLPSPYCSTRAGTTQIFVLYFVLLCSLIGNAYLLISRTSQTAAAPPCTISNAGSATTTFASLKYDQTRQIQYEVVSSNKNTSQEEIDRIWLDYEQVRLGMVALDSSYAREKGLLPSQQFFWDENKSLYVLNGYHLLHCLQIIYRDIMEFKQGMPIEAHTNPPSHVAHCLAALRFQVVCEADDTPLYFNKAGGGSGDGQTRKCRDWSRLEAWALEHESCYRKIDPGNKTMPEIERFKFCRKGSQYLPLVQEYFGHGGSGNTTSF